ncbi:hypothetical protein HDE_13924 [Halotydeus destructor]|nr:hypothetical protein HDE_13924 [Halotydeus destructor]
MEAVNLLILILTFIAVSFICWGLVIIYCCVRHVLYCDSDPFALNPVGTSPPMIPGHRGYGYHVHGVNGPLFAEVEATKVMVPVKDIVYI